MRERLILLLSFIGEKNKYYILIPVQWTEKRNPSITGCSVNECRILPFGILEISTLLECRYGFCVFTTKKNNLSLTHIIFLFRQDVIKDETSALPVLIRHLVFRGPC